MPTPIVIQPRRNQFGQLLGTLLLQKIAHNQDMDREKLKIEAKKAEVKEQGKTTLKVAGWKELPESAKRHAEKTGVAQSDVENVYGTWMRRPRVPQEQIIGEWKGMAVISNPETGGLKLKDIPNPTKAETPEQKLERQKKLIAYRNSLSQKNYANNLSVAAQAVGIDPNEVRSGKLTPDKAIKLGTQYSKMFGTQSLLQLLFGGASGGQDTVRFDEKGELVE